MKKLWKWIIGGVLLLALAAAGALLYIRSVAPPGEEWIAYGNEVVIASIDRQLSGLDMERVRSEKESFLLERSVPELQAAVARGELSYEELTALCLLRIQDLDQRDHGYNAVTAVALDALEQAREKDRARAAAGDGDLPALFGIPVLLKDNINTAGIPTSAGAAAFADFVPAEDAALVTALRDQGAVILGKSNLSEFAGFSSAVAPAGYSGSKGQTVNPFAPLRLSPSGSSSGSAVAVTANLVPLSVGTETAGSIVGPASANSVVGFKPSRGRVSAQGVFPLISAVDTPGPIAKTVGDAALAYAALSGEEVPTGLDTAELRGASIGLAFFGYEDEAAIQALRETLESAGARVEDVELSQEGVSVQTLIPLTFRGEFEAFTQQYGLPITTLEELVAYNREDPERRARYGQDLLEAARDAEQDPGQIEDSIQQAEAILSDLFARRGLDAVVFLNTAGSTVVSAAGWPELTVPFGTDGRGAPQGATFTAPYGEDPALLRLGAAFERVVGGRTVPR